MKSSKPRADYHTHTYYSDGVDSPTQLIKWAKEQGLEIIAVTDHDGVAGIPEAIIAGEALDIKVIPGIEFSTKTQEGIGLHILGYHIDIENKQLLEACEEIRVMRAERNQRMIDALDQLGYPLKEEDLTLRPGQDFIGKPIIARAMVNKGYINNTKEAFDNIFTEPTVKAIKKGKILASKSIELIKGAGGIAVLAHPCLVKKIGQRGREEFYQALEEIVFELKKQGLKGLECYHSDHSEEECLRMVEIAEKYRLHITNGSDYHGEFKPE